MFPAVWRAWTKTLPDTVALTQAMSGLHCEGQRGLPTAGYGRFRYISSYNYQHHYGLVRSLKRQVLPSLHTHTHTAASMAGSPVPQDLLIPVHQDLLIPCSRGFADALFPGSPVFTLRRCRGEHYLGGDIGCPYRTMALSLSLGIISPNDHSQQ